MKSPISPTIGLVSGLGMRATAPFIDLVAKECRIQYGARHDSDFPRMLIASEPAAEQEALRNGMQQLVHAGADFLAVASDAAPMHFPQLAESVGVRVLNPVDLMLEAIPLSTPKLALVATRPVVESEIWQRALWRRGHKLVDPEWQQEVDALVDAAGTSNDAHRLAQCWRNLLARAGEAGVDTVLVACLNLGPVLTESESSLHIVDATRCLARGIVAEWLAWCVEE